MCVPWELNPQPFALLTQCSTTEPQEPHAHAHTHAQHDETPQHTRRWIHSLNKHRDETPKNTRKRIACDMSAVCQTQQLRTFLLNTKQKSHNLLPYSHLQWFKLEAACCAKGLSHWELTEQTNPQLQWIIAAISTAFCSRAWQLNDLSHSHFTQTHTHTLHYMHTSITLHTTKSNRDAIPYLLIKYPFPISSMTYAW